VDTGAHLQFQNQRDLVDFHLEKSQGHLLDIYITTNLDPTPKYTPALSHLVTAIHRWRSFTQKSERASGIVATSELLVNQHAPQLLSMYFEVTTTTEDIDEFHNNLNNDFDILGGGAPVLYRFTLKKITVTSVFPPLAIIRALHLEGGIFDYKMVPDCFAWPLIETRF